MFQREWNGVCACGKAEADGVRCRLGATHRPRLVMPWVAKPEPSKHEKEKLPWEK